MLSASELSQLARELASALGDTRVQGIHGPAAERFVLEFYARGARRRLLIALERPFPRVHLAAERPPNPPRPFPLVEILRRELDGSILRELEALPGERILRLRFEAKRDDALVERFLFVELFPASRNLILVDAAEKVLAALRPGRAGLRAGGAYARPERRGSAPAAAAPPFSFLDSPPEPGALSEALEAWVAPRESRSLRDAAESQLSSSLRRRLKKERKLLGNLDTDLAAAECFYELRQRGELLRTNLHRLRDKAPSARVSEFTDEGEREVEIALDPRLTPKENMEKLFAEARRRERALPRLAERRHRCAERCAELEKLEAAIADASEDTDWGDVEDLARRLGLVTPPPTVAPAPAAAARSPERRLPYRRFVSADGLEILVGRTSADNDTLSFKVARGNDWWLHADGFAGSHVVIRNPGLAELPSETLLDAALLAAHYSKAPAGSACGVSWTQRKHVAKFRGARSGQVQLARRKTLRIRRDPERLARLLASPKSKNSPT